VVTQASALVQVRLPAGGWLVGFRMRPDGRTVVEVTDPDDALAGLIVSTSLPILSIEAGWAGRARGSGESGSWWALAIGRVPAATGQPTVTFTRSTRRGRRGRMKLPPETVDGLWLVHDGLWVAAATGRYTHAS
jgi:hypothetical protein